MKNLGFMPASRGGFILGRLFGLAAFRVFLLLL
jgi:hypothetical protein